MGFVLWYIIYSNHKSENQPKNNAMWLQFCPSAKYVIGKKSRLKLTQFLASDSNFDRLLFKPTFLVRLKRVWIKNSGIGVTLVRPTFLSDDWEGSDRWRSRYKFFIFFIVIWTCFFNQRVQYGGGKFWYICVQCLCGKY